MIEFFNSFSAGGGIAFAGTVIAISVLLSFWENRHD